MKIFFFFVWIKKDEKEEKEANVYVHILLLYVPKGKRRLFFFSWHENRLVNLMVLWGRLGHEMTFHPHSLTRQHACMPE